MIPWLPAADPLQERIRKLQHLDGWRGAPPRCPPQWTEWQHFVILDGNRGILLNFNLHSDTSPVTRVLALSTDGHTWRGGVEEVAATLRAGTVDCFFGRSSVRLTAEGYRIHLATQHIEGELHLEPISSPLYIPGIRLDPHHRFHWLSVPRMVASGRLRVGGEPWSFERIPAYHDHNWGSFSPHADYSWEWGFALPVEEEQPWSAVFMRVSDRARHRCRVQGLALWRDGRLFASFRDAELQCRSEGIHHPPHSLVVPEALSHTVSTGGSMPQIFRMSASRGQDHLELELIPGATSRILLPSGENTAMLSEALASVTLCGIIQERTVNFRGIGMLEVTDGE